MRRIRDLLRLKYAQGLSERAIALSLGRGKGTVGDYLARARQADLSWPLPPELDDDSLELLLFSQPDDGLAVEPACAELGGDGPRVTPAQRDVGAVVGGVSGPVCGRVWLCLVLRAF